jgi:gliding motility-associated-like protein
VTLNSLGTANQYLWYKDRGKKELIASSSDSIIELFSPINTKFYYSASNGDCLFEDSLQLNIIQNSMKISGNTSLCYKSLDTLKATVESYKQFYSFDWYPKASIREIISDTTVLIYPKKEEYIYAIGTGVGNQFVPCTVKDSIKITLKQNNLIDFKITASKIKVIKGGEVTLSVPPELGTYVWSPSDQLTIISNHLVKTKILEPSVFSVVLQNEGCTVYDTITINLADLQCDFPFVFVPNAFTPNHDNENDVLYVRGGIVKEILFRIYNRWGEKVFESTSLDNGWDGTFKGELLPPDVYDYYLLVECVGGLKNQLQGNVTLIR